MAETLTIMCTKEHCDVIIRYCFDMYMLSTDRNIGHLLSLPVTVEGSSDVDGSQLTKKGIIHKVRDRIIYT